MSAPIPSTTLPVSRDSGVVPRVAFAEECAEIVRPNPEIGDSLRDRWALIAGSVASIPILVLGAWLYYSYGMGWRLLAGVFASLALSWSLSYWAAERFTASIRRSLEHLAEQCCSIDSEWRYTPDTRRRESSAPAEVRRLGRDFDRMARRVDGSFERLRGSLQEAKSLESRLEKLVENREDEIRTRTVELQVANSNLERLAREDALTGIANHRRFVEFGDQVWRLCMREERPVSILMIDVDHFKAYNDIYGHQAGDQCLRQVSEAIATIARRPLDLAARYGGEEFALILSHTELDDALSLAEQARRAVMARDIPHAGSSDYGKVTISIGVATLVPHRDTEVTTLISLADRALYRAKRGGRNRFER